MASQSAGLLMWKREGGALKVLLVHPGGPYWQRRDAGAWSIPKGGHAEGETPLAAARREFSEELGCALGHLPDSAFRPLGDIRQKGGKRVTAFALEGDFDPRDLRSNLFEIEWPPSSGRRRSYPEVDRAAWFSLAEAQEKILAAQRPLLDALAALEG